VADAKGDGAHGVKLTGRPNLTVTFDPEDDESSAAGGGNTTAAARIVNAIPSCVRRRPACSTRCRCRSRRRGLVR